VEVELEDLVLLFQVEQHYIRRWKLSNYNRSGGTGTHQHFLEQKALHQYFQQLHQTVEVEEYSSPGLTRWFWRRSWRSRGTPGGNVEEQEILLQLVHHKEIQGEIELLEQEEVEEEAGARSCSGQEFRNWRSRISSNVNFRLLSHLCRRWWRWN
jgi:hypothetical protein